MDKLLRKCVFDEMNDLGTGIDVDTIILYSYINTMLRDRYSSLNEFCLAEDVTEEEITKRMSAAGFSYVEDINQFR